ncbi:hypothetical protein, partial [Pseudomonas sp. EA_65y_Pfl2_P78]|uniref:hypothetical protein n=1 Tax=Pseudomonas sp. EA_65y_Pfl2_P78 TaxID=3088695 RepID=UPI0030D6F86D
VWPDKKLGADGHCDVEPGSAAADREKSGIVRRRRDNNLEKRRRLIIVFIVTIILSNLISCSGQPQNRLNSANNFLTSLTPNP